MKFFGRYKLLISSATALMFFGCSNASLYKGIYNANSTAAINFCTTPAAQITPALKYIFVFDSSNSTSQNYIPADLTTPPYSLSNPYYTAPDYALDPLGGTDQYGQRRFGQLVNYLKSINDTPTTFYSVIEFGNSATVKENWLTAGVKTPLTTVETFLETQCSLSPVPSQNYDPNCHGTIPQLGDTDYLDTIADSTNQTNVNTIYGMIYNDIQNAVAAQKAGNTVNTSAYVIFWLSDGVPFVQTNGGQMQSETQILGEVSSLVNLQTQYPNLVDSVTFNTGFFHLDHTVPDPYAPAGPVGFPPPATPPYTIAPWDDPVNNGVWQYAEIQDQEAAIYMSDMAASGHGQFIDFGFNVINYSQFSIPTQLVKYQLTNFWIHDASAVWWPNSQGQPTLMLDSDNDGIPDVIETQMGSNPNKYDSDGNGLGDGVEYRIYGTPCGDSKCANNANTRAPTPGLASVKGSSPNSCYYKIPTADPTIYDSDCDFLNDYEEAVLHSNAQSMDSNSDGVPDQFEFIENVLFLPNTNSLNAIPQNDGFTDLQKLKMNYPMNFPVSELHGYTPLNYTLTQTSDSPIQTCYSVNVQNLATMGPADEIRAYIVESKGAVGTVPKFRTAQKITNGNLVLTDSDFH